MHRVTAVGNCHIGNVQSCVPPYACIFLTYLFPLDTAWLWPYDETKRKVARSWSSQLNLIERYPDYVFTASQVQQYEWLQELYPKLFEKIKAAEKNEQWEIIGGVSNKMNPLFITANVISF